MDCIAKAIGKSTYMDAHAGVNLASTGIREAGSDDLEIETLDPCADPSWDREAISHSDCTAFHTSAWATVLIRTYGHRAEYMRITRSGKLVALVPMMGLRSRLSGNRGVCLPFTDFCEPLIFAETDLAALGAKIAGLAHDRKWRYFEIRGMRLSPATAKAAIGFHGHTVDLTGQPDPLAKLDPAVRRAVRKAERSGLEFRALTTREAMLDFYRLHVQTRKRHGLPPQPISFFLNIQKYIFEKGLGFASLALSGKRAVAAAVFFHQGTKAIFKFGASDREFQALRPNNLVMWHGMRFLASRGIKNVHLGRTSLHNEGLRRFKLGWGATENLIEYAKYSPAANTWLTSADRVAGFHNAVFSHLPLAINRLMGSLIYPHLD